MTTAELVALLVAAVACVYDIKSQRIPNALTFGAAAVALVYHGASPAGVGFAAAVGGLSVGLLVFFPFFALGAMGAGDVKLMAALGAWMGWHPIVFIALYGAVAGGLLAVGVALGHGYLRQAFRNVWSLVASWASVGIKPLPALTLDNDAAVRMPYAVPIAIGLLVTLWRV